VRLGQHALDARRQVLRCIVGGNDDGNRGGHFFEKFGNAYGVATNR
jgi:hypothetical protein